MEIVEKTPQQILLDAANLLGQEGIWGKGSYFQKGETSNSPCIMCAHGAIEYCGSAKVKQAILAKDISKANDYINQIYSNTERARNMAVRAGLTFVFNDTVAKTKQDVINKLREAALLSPL